jgi:prolyl-tRNA editing enzyme YbaK/EbsC (Cys-tRNA(Pro) deacylase)
LTVSEDDFGAPVKDGLKTIVDERALEGKTVYGRTDVHYHSHRISPQDMIMLAQAQALDIKKFLERIQPQT